MAGQRVEGNRAVVRIGCTGAVLALLLIGLRAQIISRWADLRTPIELSRRLAVAAYAADPHEALNLAAGHPDVILKGRERLAARMQYQNRFYRRFLRADVSR
jgi:hypothetical protein